MSLANESLVDLRCAVAVVRRYAVSLLQRHHHVDWVLPDEFDASARLSGETNGLRAWVNPADPKNRGGARSLGNVWRPQWGDP